MKGKTPLFRVKKSKIYTKGEQKGAREVIIGTTGEGGYGFRTIYRFLASSSRQSEPTFFGTRVPVREEPYSTG
jgi:hypothetical protein